MPASRKSTICVVIVALAITFQCAGCTIGRHRICPAIGRYDIEPQYRSASFQEVGISYTPRLVKIDVEYRMWGRNWKTISRQITPEIVSGLTANRVFVVADNLNEAEAGRLHVVVRQEVTTIKFLEVLAKSAITGCTYLLVPTSANMYYNMEVTYTPPRGEAVTWKSRSPVHTTVGVLAASVHNENSLPPREVLPVLTEGMAANFALDFAKHDAATRYASAPTPTLGDLGSTESISRLPQAEVLPHTDGVPHAVQPAAATESAPTFLR